MKVKLDRILVLELCRRNTTGGSTKQIHMRQAEIIAMVMVAKRSTEAFAVASATRTDFGFPLQSVLS